MTRETGQFSNCVVYLSRARYRSSSLYSSLVSRKLYATPKKYKRLEILFRRDGQKRGNPTRQSESSFWEGQKSRKREPNRPKQKVASYFFRLLRLNRQEKLVFDKKDKLQDFKSWCGCYEGRHGERTTKQLRGMPLRAVMGIKSRSFY